MCTWMSRHDLILSRLEEYQRHQHPVQTCRCQSKLLHDYHQLCQNREAELSPGDEVPQAKSRLLALAALRLQAPYFCQHPTQILCVDGSGAPGLHVGPCYQCRARTIRRVILACRRCECDVQQSLLFYLCDDCDRSRGPYLDRRTLPHISAGHQGHCELRQIWQHTIYSRRDIFRLI
jgi:hypothetical protein